jgi:hypothetical protein
VRLEPLYRVLFTYSGGWTAGLAEPESAESQHFFLTEGRCEGRITGRFRGANYPHRRSDGTFLPDFQSVIETDDGAEVLFDYTASTTAASPTTTLRLPIKNKAVLLISTSLARHSGCLSLPYRFRVQRSGPESER